MLAQGGNTALHVASNRGHHEVVQVLLQDPRTNVNMVNTVSRIMRCRLVCVVTFMFGRMGKQRCRLQQTFAPLK